VFALLTPAQSAYLFAILGNICFASASLVFASYSKKVSAYWMNAFKTVVTWLALLLLMIFIGYHSPSLPSLSAFLASGFLGLNLGDLFLLSAFVRLGSSRSLMIFGFQPLFMGVASYFLFGQEVGPWRFLSLIFLVGCLFFFSLEKYKQEGHWEIRGLMFALIGMGFDTIGVLLSRWGFDASPAVPAMEGHFYRCFGAVLGFALMARFWKPLNLLAGFRRWNNKQRALIVCASWLGTLLSLYFYLTAVRVGHLASLAGIAVTGPLFASLLELIWKKERPSPYSLAALACFLTGFIILIEL
jgi:drug/metabolite transporter (DMT)-like permease